MFVFVKCIRSMPQIYPENISHHTLLDRRLCFAISICYIPVNIFYYYDIFFYLPTKQILLTNEEDRFDITDQNVTYELRECED